MLDNDQKIMAPFNIRAFVTARAEIAPDAAAIAAPGRAPLTYRRLLDCLYDIAGTLAGWGIGRHDRVAVVLPNGPEIAVTFLGVASVAACASLNPALRESEFASLLESLRPKALILEAGADSPAREAANRLGILQIELSPIKAAEAGSFTLAGERVGEVVFSGPDDEALLMFTSGTTSKPKLVPLTHRNLCASARNNVAAFALAPDDRCLNIMPMFHIQGLVGILLSSLAAGASMVCTPGFFTTSFFDWVDECAPTWYSAVPTMHQALLGQAVEHRETIARHPFRFIRSCAAKLPPKVMALMEETYGAPVIEVYGMTEAAQQIACTLFPPGARKTGSVGLPAGPEVAIMDEGGNLLPAGVKGEIAIRGENVMIGYADNPEANQQLFTNGWLRSGDQGYLDDDGYLFITGRIKEMINRGGEKISPLEIEEALLDHPSVAQAVAFAVPHPLLGEEVAAAVVLRLEGTATERELRAFLSARLADYKIPWKIVFHADIPKSPTGKFQRIGLAEKLGMQEVLTKEEEAHAYVAPSTPLEAELAETCAQVLGLERVGVDDDFLQLGGDSMLATLFLTRIRDAMQVTVTPIDFFDAPTMAGLARRITELKAGHDDAAMAALLTELENLSEEDARQLFSGEA
jgi:acyl-CoA synthetase (AMP-forming)/AMP-acid ligase II